MCEENCEHPDNVEAHNKCDNRSYTIEEALRLTKTGRYHYYLLAVSSLAVVGAIMELNAMGVTLPSTKCDFDLTIGQEGFIRSTGFIGVVCSSHMWGFFTDTYGRKKTLWIAQALTIISSVLSSFSLNAWMLIVFRFIGGVW